MQARADFDVLIEDLEVIAMWSMPEFRMLTGKKYMGLGELRFETNNVQHRVIGFHGPAEADFTLLIGCTHKQKIYKPNSALDTAVRRMRMVKSRQVEVVDHE